MIGTIGSLVEEATDRRRWPLATSLYIAACLGTAMLLGAAFGIIGQLGGRVVCASGRCPGAAGTWVVGMLVVGILAIAYAASDVGLVSLPRPTLMPAVPVTWWRLWRPYGAALAYGAALGLGLTTRIHFGAFYVLCALAVVQGDPGRGALLMGTYGAARALVLLPASWGAYRHRGAVAEWLATSPYFDLERTRRGVAVALAAFGAQAVVAAALAAFAHA
jgi:hypothetical protein